jgi:tetratricopeptide (TPR) repeat protein
VALHTAEPEPSPEAEGVAATGEAPTPAAARAWPDLSDEIAEARFFREQGLDEDADAALDDLLRDHPGHPELERLRAEWRGGAPAAPHAAQPVVLAEEPRPTPTATPGDAPAAAESVEFAFTDDEDEDYLAGIFAEGPKAKKQAKVAAKASVDDADAATRYDLGVAYREMGLVDDAITQFESAARDAVWRARSLVMLGALRLHRGEPDAALSDLADAIAAAANTDELVTARYERGLVLERLGRLAEAIEQLEEVAAGFRERDERLVELRAALAAGDATE